MLKKNCDTQRVILLMLCICICLCLLTIKYEGFISSVDLTVRINIEYHRDTIYDFILSQILKNC